MCNLFVLFALLNNFIAQIFRKVLKQNYTIDLEIYRNQ